jgi:hypothetical protein
LASHWWFKYYFGVFLPKLCDAWQLDRGACEPLHKAFKEAFDIDSTSYLDDDSFHNYIDSLHGLLLVEFGIFLPYINEPADVADISMKEFINLYKNMES